MRKFQNFLSELIPNKGNDLYRYKGVLSIQGVDQKFVFQGVHMLFDGDFTVPWGPDEVRENRAVFIGKNIDREVFEEAFKSFVFEGPLRFREGDQVECSIAGGFVPATVVQTWWNGNPYQLQLANGVLVFAPEDKDVFVRRRGPSSPS